jgi:EAL domain-containing protein (putative c-di-GMP-specific phosphodiesterase class I)
MPAGGLCVELTETVILDKSSTTAQAIASLRELGIELSIDDFGAGYTSLSYLKRLPFGELKIDKSFVDGIEHDADSKAIVAAVITLAHNLGLGVVAEGVETAAQHAFLTAKGCDQCQGYLFSRPVDADAFAAWLLPRDRRVLRAS